MLFKYLLCVTMLATTFTVAKTPTDYKYCRMSSYAGKCGSKCPQAASCYIGVLAYDVCSCHHITPDDLHPSNQCEDLSVCGW